MSIYQTREKEEKLIIDNNKSYKMHFQNICQQIE